MTKSRHSGGPLSEIHNVETKERKEMPLFWGQYHGDRRPSSNNSLHSPTVIPPSALNKPSIIKRYHHRRMCSHSSPHRSPTMVTLHDTQFVKRWWWNEGWTVKSVVTWRLLASMTPVPGWRWWCHLYLLNSVTEMLRPLKSPANHFTVQPIQWWI